MASAARELPLVDPTKTARFPVVLGETLSRAGRTSERRHAINYKPELLSTQRATITPAQRSSDAILDLTITDSHGQGQYRYRGTQQPSGACALIYNPATQSFLLDRIDSDFNFNLQTTPSNSRRSEVTAQYPQLDTGLSDLDSNDGDLTDLFGDDNDTQEPDPGNPYDYRHFLKRRRTSSPEPPPTLPSRGPTASPLTPPCRPPRANSSLKPKPRPSRATQHRPSPSPPPREELADADNEDSDDGDVLTIEMGDGPSPKARRFGNGAVVFNHDRRNGPISLRSAASSMSPASSVRHDSEAEKQGAGSDRDVEHLRLPSPRREVGGARKKEEPAQRQHEKEEDEEMVVVEDDEEKEAEEDGADLLEAELQQALDSQEEEDEEEEDKVEEARAEEVRRAVEESSSSSEEE
ncbi:MAG: hypothetical protein Q9190_000527 [Brigantiaea leucoxantha]